jgi:hypothetical protein
MALSQLPKAVYRTAYLKGERLPFSALIQVRQLCVQPTAMAASGIRTREKRI